MTETEKLLCEMIALPSVNPAFLPANHPHAGEARMADYAAVYAARAGLDVDLQPVLSGRSNVLATLSPSGQARRRILLAPHLDTVNVAAESQFAPRLARGRIYGRGSCDDKGSVAVMLSALRALAKSGGRPAATEIVFAGLVDEEDAQSGSRALSASGLRADLAVVGEPTRLQVVTAHKGSPWFRIETRGRAAHGSCPDLGKNAVHEMARVVDLLETVYARELRKRRHPLLGRPTVNVGYIRGGSQPNIVPASCVIGVDRRTIPGETEDTARAEILALLKRHGLRATVTCDKSVPCPPLETNPNLPPVQSFLQVARQKKPAGVNYYCDAANLARGGIPSIVFGPGDIAQAHTDDEWVARKSLADGTALLLQFLRSLP